MTKPKMMTLQTELILGDGICQPKTFGYQRKDPGNPKSPVMALIVCECGWADVGLDWESIGCRYDDHLHKGGYALSDLNDD